MVNLHYGHQLWPGTVLGEVHLPIQIGSLTASVNFIVADVTESTNLGHPFLEQSRACLDFGVQRIVLFRGA